VSSGISLHGAPEKNKKIFFSCSLWSEFKGMAQISQHRLLAFPSC
jgi:hypothetical protein